MKLTGVGRIAIGLIVAAILGLGYYYFGDKLKAVSEQDKAEAAISSEGDGTVATAGETATAGSSSSSSETASANASESFSYQAIEPVGGKLKGVVELGASGFNSFIVNIDKQKNWKLAKADFGNSMVIENMATDDDVRIGLKKYISGMLDYGVGGKDIHFVVSSGAQKAENTIKIMNVLKAMGYKVNTVTPEQEGSLALKCVLPREFEDKGFVADIGSGNTKISWKQNGTVGAVEAVGAKYFQNSMDDATAYADVKAKASQVPGSKNDVCFIIGGVPFEMAKQARNGKERYTVLKDPSDYKMENAKSKAGLNIYKSLKDATGCKQFVFDWDANFTIGFLLGLP
jgi:Ppx/GppA phosphatase family